MAPPELMSGLRRICDEHGIVFVADEVQTGFGRTGKMFAMEHYAVEPDLDLRREKPRRRLPAVGRDRPRRDHGRGGPGGLGGTYAGNPLACAAALAVLDVFEEEKLVERANTLGAQLKARLEAIARSNTALPIAAIRGPGAMVAFDIVKERGSDDPDSAATKRVVSRAAELGLILLSCGVNANTIRILTPLTAPDAVVVEGLDLLEAAMQG